MLGRLPAAVVARCCAFLALGDQIEFSRASRFAHGAARQPNPAYPRAQRVAHTSHLAVALSRSPSCLEISRTVTLSSAATLVRVAMTKSIGSLRLTLSSNVGGFACLRRLTRLHTLDVTIDTDGRGPARGGIWQEVYQSLAAFAPSKTLTALSVTMDHLWTDLRQFWPLASLVTLRLRTTGPTYPRLLTLAGADVAVFAGMRSLTALEISRAQLADDEFRKLLAIAPQLASLSVGQIVHRNLHWSAPTRSWRYAQIGETVDEVAIGETAAVTEPPPWSTALTALRCELVDPETATAASPDFVVLPYLKFLPALETLRSSAVTNDWSALASSARRLRRLELPDDDVGFGNFLGALSAASSLPRDPIPSPPPPPPPLLPPPIEWLELDGRSAPDLAPLALLERTLTTLVLANWPSDPSLDSQLPRLSQLTRLALPLPLRWTADELTDQNRAMRTPVGDAGLLRQPIRAAPLDSGWIVVAASATASGSDLGAAVPAASSSVSSSSADADISPPSSPTTTVGLPAPASAPSRLPRLLPRLTRIDLAIGALSPALGISAHANLSAIEISGGTYSASRHDPRYRMLLEALSPSTSRVVIRVALAAATAAPSTRLVQKERTSSSFGWWGGPRSSPTGGDGVHPGSGLGGGGGGDGGDSEMVRERHLRAVDASEFDRRVAAPLRRRHPAVDICVVDDDNEDPSVAAYASLHVD